MQRTRNLYILLAVLAVAAIATFAALQYQEQVERISTSDEIVLEVPADSVQSLSWEVDEYGSLAFKKDDDVWLYGGDNAFPVDQDTIAALLARFEEFGVTFIIQNVEDYGQYGLDNPAGTVWLETADASYEVLLGDFSTMDSQRYVSIGDGNVYLVADDPLTYFQLTLADTIDNDETPSFAAIDTIDFSGNESFTVAYDEDNPHAYSQDDVYYADDLPMDTSRVDSYAATITSLGLTDYVSYNVTDEELESYGLDSPDLTVSIDYVPVGDEDTTETFELSISRDPEASAESATDAADEEEQITAYARVGSSQIVYQITADQYTALMDASVNSLRHPELLPTDFEEVGQMAVVLDGITHVFTSDQEDGETVYYYDGEKVEFDAVQSAVTSLSAEEFTDEEPTQQEEIAVTLYLDNENYPQIEIEIYRLDGTRSLAMVDGVPHSIVTRSSMVDLIESVNAIVLASS